MNDKLAQVKSIASDVVSYARGKGADTVEAHTHISTELEVEVRHGEVENLSEAASHSIYITVSKGGRRASVSSCDFSEHALQNLTDHALFLCNYTDEDPCYTMPDKDLLATSIPELDLFDPDIANQNPENWIDKLSELEARAVDQDPRIQSDGSFLGTNISQFALANSQGFCEGLETSSISTGVSLFAEDRQDGNSGRKQSGGYSSHSCHVADLETADTIAEKAGEKVLRKLGAQKPKTGVFPVYFEPSVARSLISSLLSAMKGGLVYRRESYLADRLGQEVAIEAFSLLEEPHIPRGLNSRPFDSEGVQTTKRTLVQNGRLETFLLNTYSANKLGLTSTGHAGGYGNVSLPVGPLSLDEMLKSMGTGLWLTEMSGQGIKLISGDYSRGASGLWVENGKVQYPVSEFTISSNLDTMFKGIAMIGNNPEPRRAIITPGFVVDAMTLSGTN